MGHKMGPYFKWHKWETNINVFSPIPHPTVGNPPPQLASSPYTQSDSWAHAATTLDRDQKRNNKKKLRKCNYKYNFQWNINHVNCAAKHIYSVCLKNIKCCHLFFGILEKIVCGKIIFNKNTVIGKCTISAFILGYSHLLMKCHMIFPRKVTITNFVS